MKGRDSSGPHPPDSTEPAPDTPTLPVAFDLIRDRYGIVAVRTPTTTFTPAPSSRESTPNPMVRFAPSTPTNESNRLAHRET